MEREGDQTICPLDGEGTGLPSRASVYGSTRTVQTACLDEERRNSD